jgi:hypothetical protein
MTILNQPCPECFREEDGKWFYPCPSDDCVLHGNREDRAFAHVEASDNNCSFLCNEDGLDIATLHRVRPDEVSDTDHKAACLSDKGWQATVNLVAAAPFMLAALEAAHVALDAYSGGESSALMVVQEAIERATK